MGTCKKCGKTSLILMAILMCSGCSKDNMQASQERERDAIEASQKIQDSKYGEALDTATKGHPIDAANGLIDANNQQENYNATIAREQEYQQNQK